MAGVWRATKNDIVNVISQQVIQGISVQRLLVYYRNGILVW